MNKLHFVLALVCVGLLAFNQVTLAQIRNMNHSAMKMNYREFSEADFSQIKSTGHTIAMLMPVENIKDTQDAVEMMIPTGVPEYADVFENKISYDNPIASLNYLSNEAYPKLAAYVSQNSPDTWQRYVRLGNMPVGISCEYCCGVGPIGMTTNGNSRCGCQHNPALLAITLGLMEFTDYSDSQILYEVMRWKTLFFPKNMIELTMTVAGMDESQLNELPGMVGGC